MQYYHDELGDGRNFGNGTNYELRRPDQFRQGRGCCRLEFNNGTKNAQTLIDGQTDRRTGGRPDRLACMMLVTCHIRIVILISK